MKQLSKITCGKIAWTTLAVCSVALLFLLPFYVVSNKLYISNKLYPLIPPVAEVEMEINGVKNILEEDIHIEISEHGYELVGVPPGTYFGVGEGWDDFRKQKTVVCVKWEDATGYEETWITLEEVLELEPARPTSCGIVVAETEERIFLAMDIDDSDPNYGVVYAMISSIPRGWIIKRTEKK